MRTHIYIVLSVVAFFLVSPPEAIAQPNAGPSPRVFSAAAYDERQGAVVLYGGDEHAGSGGLLDDTWQWDGGEWSLQPIGSATFLAGHAMAYDISRGVAVMSHAGSVWERGMGEWVFRGSTRLTNGSFATLVYDSARSVSILHGGCSGVGREIVGQRHVAVSQDILNGVAADAARGHRVEEFGRGRSTGLQARVLTAVAK